jgi:aspartate aminotransferase
MGVTRCEKGKGTGVIICNLVLKGTPGFKASQRILSDPTIDHEYLPITGLPSFTSAAARLILGSTSSALNDDRVVSVQTISGTGANHLGALFLSRFYGWNGEKKIYLSNPTWGAWFYLKYKSFMNNVNVI